MAVRPALLLLHGICNNRNLFAFPGGLGEHLSQYFDIYPCDYPVSANRNAPWDFDFHLEHDLPQIWQTVCREAGCRPFVFGYSMGGMLAMAAQAAGVIDAPGIVTAASPFTYGMIPLYPPLLRTWVKISALTGYRTIPVRLYARLLCTFFFATVPVSNRRRIDELNLFRFLVRTTAVNVPVETFLQTLMWIKKRRFTDRTGEKDYLDTFKQIETPVCLIYGTHDLIAPEPTVRAGYNQVASQNKMIVSISDGNHMNMTAGAKAAEICALAAAWCVAGDD